MMTPIDWPAIARLSIKDPDTWDAAVISLLEAVESGKLIHSPVAWVKRVMWCQRLRAYRRPEIRLGDRVTRSDEPLARAIARQTLTRLPASWLVDEPPPRYGRLRAKYEETRHHEPDHP